jgi:hypothetical protein
MPNPRDIYRRGLRGVNVARGRTIAGAVGLAVSVAVTAAAIRVYEAWWTASFIAFGLMFFYLARRGATIGAALGIAAALGGSFLSAGFGAFLVLVSQASMRAACPPNVSCTDAGPLDVAFGSGLIVLGLLGFVLSARWIRGLSNDVREH